VNTGDSLLQLTVVISRPPIRVYVYPSWSTPHAHATLRAPYFWDEACPAGVDGGERLQAALHGGDDLH
jgi:hypothetical protein